MSDANDHLHDHDQEPGDGRGDPPENDPRWWTPHAVMGTLVVIGLLGFFGVFNGALALAKNRTSPPRPRAQAAATATAATAATGAPASAPDLGANHIIVQWKGSAFAPAGITRTEDEAKARATEALAKARGGAKFGDLVKEYSDDPGGAANGGDFGFVRKGKVPPGFYETVARTKVGEISDLVRSPLGFHVIQRTR